MSYGMKAANKRIMERLKRVSDGLPVGRPKRSPIAWRPMAPHKRNGEITFCSVCEGCGRTNWFHLRRMKRKLEWKPYRPQGHKYHDTTPTMDEALKNQTGLSKSLIERILDEFSHESK